ncbi:MAG: putative hydro-lyase [Massiliimalia sp.]
MAQITPKEFRDLVRKNQFSHPTAGVCAGYAQCNLVILPRELAYDFLLFTQRNPKACPVLEVGDVGSRIIRFLAENADVAKDIPLYRVYRHGVLCEEVNSIESLWQDDFVFFLIGCSFSFEGELMEAGIEIRHITQGCNVPMYQTNLDCVPAGCFSGKMVVSMRPIPAQQVVRAVSVTAQMPKVHGAPIHIGSPEQIGIFDLVHPDFGDPVEIKEGEVPVFWPCGVTPQSVVMNVKPEIAITHAPGYMFVTDIKNTVLKCD